jgi:hypothetical protein
VGAAAAVCARGVDDDADYVHARHDARRQLVKLQKQRQRLRRR